MKTLLPIILFLLFTVNCKSQQSLTAINPASSILKQKLDNAGSNHSPASATNSWLSRAQAELARSEYNFKALKGTSSFGAINREQRTGFITDGKTIVSQPIKFEESTNLWQSSIELLSVSNKGKRRLAPSQALISSKENYLKYAYDGFAVEYLNNEKGLRQNFIIHQKLDGFGKLEVALKLSGDLLPSLNKAEALELKDPVTNKTIISYDDLKVWDANHTPLNAHMELNSEKILTLVIDDANAVYPVTIDPLNHSWNWTAQGQGLLFPLLNDLTAHVLYGYSVSDAGDVNGDGFGDVIIGAPAYVQIVNLGTGSFNFVAIGAAFVYLGSASGLSASVAEVLQPSTSVAGALFGFSVSGAGDIDGDGKADLVVGAPGDHANLGITMPDVKVGKVYVYYGATLDGNVNTTPTVSVTLNLNNADVTPLSLLVSNPLYGFSVSNAGDVNGDGFADIIVGSPAYVDLTVFPLSAGILGRADVFLGSSTGLNTTPHGIKGGVLRSLFGFSVSTAGNVNNDKNGIRNIDDIIVGAPGSLNLLTVGAAYVFHGSAPAGITATTAGGANTTLSAPGLLTGTLFGFSVSNAGSVNNDLFGDVVIGEPLALEQVLSQLVAVGQAHIFYGSAGGVSTSGPTVLNSPRRPSVLGFISGNLLFGFSVSGVGDINCDGISDVIIGEPGGTALSLGTGLLNLVSTNTLGGRAYVYVGRNGAGPLNTPFWFVEETGTVTIANLVGYSVSGAGDINSDGFKDILIGAPNGTLDLNSNLASVLPSVINYITVNSIGKSYEFNGCLLLQVLPINLSSFTTKAQDCNALLEFNIAQEINLDNIEIQGGLDGISYATLQKINSKGIGNYSARVSQQNANTYYRLKINDKNGLFAYSDIKLVKTNCSGSDLIRVYPNPVTDILNLVVPAGMQNKRIILFSENGQKVSPQIMNTNGNNVTVSMKALPPGVYNVQVYEGDKKLFNTTISKL